MSWSVGIGHVAGIPVRLHLTFALVTMLVVTQYAGSHGVAGALFGVVAMLVYLTAVALHELGHALVASAFGYRIRFVMLLPSGGVTQPETAVEKPLHEAAIYLAGPLLNLAGAATTYLVIELSGIGVPLNGVGDLNPGWGSLVTILLFGNLLIGTLNLLPVFPLDGGRVLRAALGVTVGYQRATMISAWFGQGMAVLVGGYALIAGQFSLMVIAALLFFSAGRERTDARVRGYLANLRAVDVCERGLVIAPGMPLSELGSYIVRSSQQNFAVLLGEKLLGVVTRRAALEGLNNLDDNPYVASVMRRNVPQVASSVPVVEVLEHMQTLGEPVVAVVNDESELLGFISREQVLETAIRPRTA